MGKGAGWVRCVHEGPSGVRHMRAECFFAYAGLGVSDDTQAMCSHYS